jgi:hypothetical protein
MKWYERGDSLSLQAYWKIYDFHSMADFLGFQYAVLGFFSLPFFIEIRPLG